MRRRRVFGSEITRLRKILQLYLYLPGPTILPEGGGGVNHSYGELKKKPGENFCFNLSKASSEENDNILVVLHTCVHS